MILSSCIICSGEQYPGSGSRTLVLPQARNVNKSAFANIKVGVPPLPLQRKIAAILSSYDDLIENNNRRIKIMEEIARLTYHEWFVHFAFPGHENAKMIDSSLGKIPEGWGAKYLGDVCTITMGQSPRSEFYNSASEGLPFHQGVTYFGDHFPRDSVYCTVQNRIAEAGSVLFSVRTPVGRLNLADKKIVIGRGLAAIQHLQGYQVFTYQQLKEKFAEEDTMGGGTIFKSVTKDDMHKIPFLAPPVQILERFTEITTPLFRQIENLTKRNINLIRTHDLLLPRLIAGKVDASRLDISMGNVIE